MLKTILTLFAIFSTPKLVQTDDIGMIAYFEGDCPDGWESYVPLEGRVAVGSNVYFLLGEKGGEINHTLSVDEMPSHNHANGEYNQMLRRNCHSTIPIGGDRSCGEPNIQSSSNTLSMGGSQPHNNMPPYLVLTPCRKVVADNYTNQSDFLRFQRAVYSINTTYESDFSYLKSTLQGINGTYTTGITAVKLASDSADAQHDSYLALLDNRTTQIIATQVQEVTALQQAIEKVNITRQLDVSHIVSSLVDFNDTFQADIIKVWQQMYLLNRTYIHALENQVESLQQEIIILKQRLNATASPTPSPTNRVPVVNEQIPTQYATVGTLFEYIVPVNTFSDSDEDMLTLVASLVDDSVLPLWINFNSDSRKFLGIPFTEDIANLFIKVTATDLAGAQVSEVFPLIVQGKTYNATSYTVPQSNPSTHQLSFIAIALSGLNLGLCIGFYIYIFNCTSEPKDHRHVSSVSQVNITSNSPNQKGMYTSNVPMQKLPSQTKVKGNQGNFDETAYLAGGNLQKNPSTKLLF